MIYGKTRLLIQVITELLCPSGVVLPHSTHSQSNGQNESFWQFKVPFEAIVIILVCFSLILYILALLSKGENLDSITVVF